MSSLRSEVILDIEVEKTGTEQKVFGSIARMEVKDESEMMFA